MPPQDANSIAEACAEVKTLLPPSIPYTTTLLIQRTLQIRYRIHLLALQDPPLDYNRIYDGDNCCVSPDAGG